MARTGWIVLVLALASVVRAQHRMAPKGGQPRLGASDLARLADTLTRLLRQSELRQVWVAAESLRPRLVGQKGQPGFESSRRIRRLGVIAGQVQSVAATVQEGDRYLSREGFGKLTDLMSSCLVEGDLETAIWAASFFQSLHRVPRWDSRYGLRLRIDGLVKQAEVAIRFRGSVVIDGKKSYGGVVVRGELFEPGEFLPGRK